VSQGYRRPGRSSEGAGTDSSLKNHSLGWHCSRPTCFCTFLPGWHLRLMPCALQDRVVGWRTCVFLTM